MDLPSAYRFVRTHGDPSEQARFNSLTLGQPPSHEARLVLFSGQRRDGGWAPIWDPEYSSVDATCYHLAQARQLGLGRDEPEIVRALVFLTGRQATRGSWEEDAQTASVAPPWAAPGELNARLYLTANCGYWLALLGSDGAPARRAASFLRRHLKPDGHMPTFLQAHWLAAGLWTRLGQQAPARVVFAHLFTQLPGLPPANCAWLITTLRQAGTPKDHPLVQAALALLVGGQQPDGRWISEDGPARDVHATLEALHAIVLCKQAIPGGGRP